MKGESITMSKKQQKLNLDNASGGLWVGGDRAQPAWGGKEPLCSGVGVCGNVFHKDIINLAVFTSWNYLIGNEVRICVA